MLIDTEDSRAKAATNAVKTGDVKSLRTLLAQHPELSTAHFGSESEARSLLHILTDWPGCLPNAIESLSVLLDAGADINTQFVGPAHSETPLHWAASNDDVAMLDALLDAGANINADGGVIDDTPLADARAFLQLKCAHRLVERGARVTLQDAATLGLLDRVKRFYDESPAPAAEDTDDAFWNACHGSQLMVAKYLYGRGAKVNTVPPWEDLTPLDVARRSKATDISAWLESLGAEDYAAEQKNSGC